MTIILGIVGLIVGVGIIFNPFFGLILVVALIPLSFFQAVSGTLFGIFSIATPIKIIGGLTFISAFIRHLIDKKKWGIFKKPQIIFFILFLIWVYISGFSQPGFASRENFTMFTSFLLLCFIIVTLIDNMKKFRVIIWIALVSIFLVSLKAMLDFIISDNTMRVYGATYGPNEFAISLLPFLGIAFYSIFSEKKYFLKALSAIITLTIFSALVLTYSRGGLIGFFGMALIAALWSKRKFISFLILAIGLSIFIANAPAPIKERFEKIKIEDIYRSNDEAIISATRRYNLAIAGWKMFLENPVFGKGVGNYYYECRNYAPIFPGRAHNMYLEILAELGIIGFMLFGGILFSTLKILNKLTRSRIEVSNYATGLFIGLIGFMTAGLFLHAQQEKVLWFAIFMAGALEQVAMEMRDA